MAETGNKTPLDNDAVDDVNIHARGPAARLRGYLFAGIVVTAPISITIYLTYVFLTFVDSKVAGLLPRDWYDALYGATTFPGIGLVISLIGFILIGWFATNFLGRLIIRISEYIVDRMPVVRTVYSAIKQIFETIMASQSSAFREVVMLEYPRRGVWSIGFITGTSEGQIQDFTEAETMNVFVPTTPNPTSGYLLFVPRDELKFLDMSVEEGVKLVVSAGIITPEEGTSAEAKKNGKRKKK
ncbi:MAG: hypothetical protein COB14_00935 [Alphaproteobacteria bacterium]|nr:MAG: hypothetical protein COB14_00935 [Alphaproteobacteria bacterium]